MSNHFRDWTGAQIAEYNTRPKHPGMAARIEASMASELAAPVERESDLHDQIETECNRRGYLVVHSRMDMPTTTGLGVPDFIILASGRLFLIECKARNAKQTTPQLAFAMLAERNGFKVEVVRSYQAFLAIVDDPPEHAQARD